MITVSSLIVLSFPAISIIIRRYIIYYTVINFHVARPVIEISSAIGGRRMISAVPGVASPEVGLSLHVYRHRAYLAGTVFKLPVAIGRRGQR